MNVYDFDNTIYAGDSTFDFWLYCVRKFPGALRALPGGLLYGMLFQVKLCGRERFKEMFYGFLRYIPDVQKEVTQFWDCHESRIKHFYLERKKPDDLVISASPDFLISEICHRLGIAFLASPVAPDTGKLEGQNCRGPEKARRFRAEYPDAEIGQFYSDSVSDLFMARQAREAFFVKGDMVQKWGI